MKTKAKRAAKQSNNTQQQSTMQLTMKRLSNMTIKISLYSSLSFSLSVWLHILGHLSVLVSLVSSLPLLISLHLKKKTQVSTSWQGHSLTTFTQTQTSNLFQPKHRYQVPECYLYLWCGMLLEVKASHTYSHTHTRTLSVSYFYTYKLYILTNVELAFYCILSICLMRFLIPSLAVQAVVFGEIPNCQPTTWPFDPYQLL